MKLNKKKVAMLATAVCLIATLSFGSLAWFTDADAVTNEFMVAGSDDSDPDDIFSVNVWEEGEDGAKEEYGLQFNEILPGDKLEKVAHVENTGSYDQYIRVKITVSDANVWQDVYKANMVPVTEFVNLDMSDVYGIGSYQEDDNFVYYVYYNSLLTPGSDMVVFTEAYISGNLDQYQAAALNYDGVNGFQITVHADAVQTENVTWNDIADDDVYEAFQTVGMEVPVNTAYVGTYRELSDALANETEYIVLIKSIKCNSMRLQGTSAELYLNGMLLDTANAVFDGEYGVVMTGDLAISGYGTLDVGSMRMQVGSLTVYGGTIINDGGNRIVDTNGDPIVLP